MREEEKNQSSQWKKFFKKRWVFPAIYLVSAALLISMIVWYQNSIKEIAKGPDVSEPGKNPTGNTDDPVVEVNQPFENVAMPVANPDEVVYVTKFFDPSASAEEQEEAIIVDGNRYRQNMGVDLANKDGKEFEVLAALSGKVVTVRQDALLGNVIEIEHQDGIMTVYQSVKNMKVKVGDTVKQGDVLATSSTSQLNKDAKNHVHFEIRKETVALNPITYFGQSVTAMSEKTDDSGKTEAGDEMSSEDESDDVDADSDKAEADKAEDDGSSED